MRFNPSMEVFEMERWTQYSGEDIKLMRREYRKQRYILKFITTAALLLGWFGMLAVGLALTEPFVFETEAGVFYYLLLPASACAFSLFLLLLSLPKMFYYNYLKKTMSEDDFIEFKVAVDNDNIHLAPSKKSKNLARILIITASVVLVYGLLLVFTCGTTLIRVSENSIYLSGNSRSWFPQYYAQQYENLNDITCRSINGLPHLVLEETSGRQYTYRLPFGDIKAESILSKIDKRTGNRYHLLENARK